VAWLRFATAELRGGCEESIPRSGKKCAAQSIFNVINYLWKASKAEAARL
jgi:hypothetical protein